MTQDLAETAATFTRTLVHDCDMVPRACVASLALLRAELEEQKAAVYASSSLLSSLKRSGLLDGGASLLGSVATAAFANKVGGKGKSSRPASEVAPDTRVCVLTRRLHMGGGSKAATQRGHKPCVCALLTQCSGHGGNQAELYLVLWCSIKHGVCRQPR